MPFTTFLLLNQCNQRLGQPVSPLHTLNHEITQCARRGANSSHKMPKHYLGGLKQLDSLESEPSRQAATGMREGGRGKKRWGNGTVWIALKGAPDCVLSVVPVLFFLFLWVVKTPQRRSCLQTETLKIRVIYCVCFQFRLVTLTLTQYITYLSVKQQKLMHFIQTSLKRLQLQDLKSQW